jgi:hypothetical protein
MFTGSSDPTMDEIRKMLVVVVAIFGVFHMLSGIVAAVSYCLLRQDKEGVSHEELARVFE